LPEIATQRAPWQKISIFINLLFGPLMFCFFTSSQISFICFNESSLARTIASVYFAKNFTAAMFDTFSWVDVWTVWLIELAYWIAEMSEQMIASIFSFFALSIIFCISSKSEL